MRRYRESGLLAIGAAALLTLTITGTAGAAPVVQTTMVSEDPAGFTPRVATGTAIYKLLQVGPTMFAGGDFSQVRNATGQTTFDRDNLFSFNATSGAVTPVSVSFNGPVWAMATDGTSLWVGGEFTQVNGDTHRKLVKLDPTNGVVDATFNPGLTTGDVTDAQLVNGRLIIGGKFSKALLALDPDTGADTGYLNLGVTGTVAPTAGPTDIYRFAVDPAGTRLVAIGNFSAVGNATRYRAFMVNLGGTASLASWYYTALNRACRSAVEPAQLRDVDFSPDGSFFVIVATGYLPQTGDQGVTICDAAARFNSNVANPTRPVWMNYTGGDTLQSVAVTNAAVYIQGHQRWVSSTGVGCTWGCFSREGIAALAPASGMALTWNPGKERGVGGKDLLLTSAPAGLWVPSDTTQIGNPREAHQNLAFLPLTASAPQVAIPPPTPTCAGRTATIIGTDAPNTIVGTSGADVIVALGGADVIRGRGGKDTVCGGSGKDRIKGGAAKDRIRGGAGDDKIRGGSGRDEIRGGAGADRIRGGPGKDRVSAGPGVDTCRSPKHAPGCNL